MEEKVYGYIEQHRMLQSGDRVLAGVSGGADSVCLLFLLARYREKIPFDLAVVHVNHGIRPDAGEDAAYVKELCGRLRLPFFPVNADVPGLARAEGISEEEAGRRARYEAFEKYAGEWGGRGLDMEGAGEGPGIKLALAHHMGDRAETFLFHLFRGTGSRGLGSIQPVREHGGGKLTVIRPLLCLERREIEEYLEERGISYRTDSTNQEDGYARNRIRHHVLPWAEQEICRGAVRHISEAADRLSEIEEYLTAQTALARESCVRNRVSCVRSGESFVQSGESCMQSEESCVRNGESCVRSRESCVRNRENCVRNEEGCMRNRESCVQNREGAEGREIQVDKFLEFPPLLQKRVLLELLLEVSPLHKDIGAVHVEMLRGLFLSGTGKSVSLPCGIRAERSYDRIILEREPLDEGEKPDPGDVAIEISLPGDLLEDWRMEKIFRGTRFTFHILNNYKFDEMPKNQCTKWFDCDKIISALSIRTRRTGDYFMIRDGGGELIRKKLKDYMITEKIPREQRDSLPLLTDGNHVLWMPGYRTSEAYRPDKGTKHVLQVVFEKTEDKTWENG